MTENDEQELHEFVRLKHHSHGLKNQQLGKFPLFRDQGVGSSHPPPNRSHPRQSPTVRPFCSYFPVFSSPTATIEVIGNTGNMSSEKAGVGGSTLPGTPFHVVRAE